MSAGSDKDLGSTAGAVPLPSLEASIAWAEHQFLPPTLASPTVEELEAILRDPLPMPIQIKTDGSIEVVEHPEAAFLRVLISAANCHTDLLEALRRARTILANMARENKPEIAFRWQRWPISHEPLRADAKNLLPEIDMVLSKATQPPAKAGEANQ